MYQRRFSGHRPAFRGYGSRSSNQGSSRSRYSKLIDPRLFVRPACQASVEEIAIQHDFVDFNLHPKLLENLRLKGFTKPTPIQDMALKPALSNRDVLGLADTGTGKTAVYVLPILNQLINNPGNTSIIIAPTRELALQIRDEIRSLSFGLSIYSCLLIGGANIYKQMDELRRHPHIYIGTPGRLKDLHTRQVLNLNNTHTVVLDEVDRMLDMGFVKDITALLSLLPKERQTLLFSATINDRVEKIALDFMKNPEKISIKTNAGAQNVDQNVVHTTDKSNKVSTLRGLLCKAEFKKVLVFSRTKHGAENLSRDLEKSGFSAGAIHGNKRQSQRERVLRQFRTNEIKILIATDVAARGLDVKDITHVINFDQPATYDDYIHRIGRTGRAGKTGIALTFVD
jgi:ATP-dependent RNA helicase RhlE